MINLLKSWYNEKLDIEINSIEISKKKVIEILSSVENNKIDHIIEQFNNSLPETWKISNDLYSKISANDFETEITFLTEYQNQKDDLLKILNTYFELPSN